MRGQSLWWALSTIAVVGALSEALAGDGWGRLVWAGLGIVVLANLYGSIQQEMVRLLIVQHARLTGEHEGRPDADPDH